MKFEKWASIYDQIAADFGYDPAADRRARDVLATLVTVFDLKRLDFDGKTVAIAVGTGGLGEELEAVRRADRVVAVSNAAKVLYDAGIEPDLVVTDLDGTPETARQLSIEGVPVAVHAHGDNIEAVESLVPAFNEQTLIGTTQVEPTDEVYNFGGFTDGDRAAFIADHLGAETLTFPGWELDDQTVSATKARKLDWAALLLRCLEIRRSERFGILDGYREEIDTASTIERWPCTESG